MFFLENFCSKVFQWNLESNSWDTVRRKYMYLNCRKSKHYLQNHFLFFTFNSNIGGGFILLKSKISITSFNCREDQKKKKPTKKKHSFPPLSMKFSLGKQTQKNIYINSAKDKTQSWPTPDNASFVWMQPSANEGGVSPGSLDQVSCIFLSASELPFTILTNLFPLARLLICEKRLKAFKVHRKRVKFLRTLQGYRGLSANNVCWFGNKLKQRAAGAPLHGCSFFKRAC